MSIKVVIPSGKTEATATSLFQWDYGQILEIESSEIGSEICEVHFACSGMSEAIVRPCSFSAGLGTVPIPDQCLEQTTPITAWIYRIHNTNGYTWKAIKIPVVTRTRPSCNRDIPQEVTNRYTELITEVNEAVNALEDGTVVAAEAKHAQTANSATSATNAVSATNATNATQANRATVAECDVNNKSLADCIHWDVDGSGYVEYKSNGNPLQGGLYAFRLVENGAVTSLIVDVKGSSGRGICYSNLFVSRALDTSPYRTLRLVFNQTTGPGEYSILLQSISGDTVVTVEVPDSFTIYYKHLAGEYPFG